MKILISLILLLGVSSCGSDNDIPIFTTQQKVNEKNDVKYFSEFVRSYSSNSITPDTPKKYKFYEDDNVTVTLESGDTLDLKLNRISEGTENTVGSRLQDLCDGETTGNSTYSDISLIDSEENTTKLVILIWEGTCNGYSVSCAGAITIDNDFGDYLTATLFNIIEEDSSDCAPIFNSSKSLLVNQLDTF